MQHFDIFRHATDDETVNKLTLLGYEQIKKLIQGIKSAKVVYHSFITIPYSQCVKTIKLIMDLLGYKENLLDKTVKLCTQEPKKMEPRVFFKKISETSSRCRE